MCPERGAPAPHTLTHTPGQLPVCPQHPPHTPCQLPRRKGYHCYLQMSLNTLWPHSRIPVCSDRKLPPWHCGSGLALLRWWPRGLHLSVINMKGQVLRPQEPWVVQPRQAGSFLLAPRAYLAEMDTTWTTMAEAHASPLETDQRSLGWTSATPAAPPGWCRLRAGTPGPPWPHKLAPPIPSP